jgi:predicted nucleic acid-binding protein
MIMIIYLDICCFNRPFDDQSSFSIKTETEAKLAIQDMIKNHQLQLGWSYIMDHENYQNPYVERKIEINKWRELLSSLTLENQQIIKKANVLKGKGLHSLDALHLASAISLKCDYFITVDKGILKKNHFVSEIEIVNPVDFILMMENKNED